MGMPMNELRNAALVSDDVFHDVYAVLERETFSWITDAWSNDPNPSTVSWESLPPWKVGEKLGYDSVEECQHACDAQRSQLALLRVGGESCCVKLSVIEQLRSALGR